MACFFAALGAAKPKLKRTVVGVGGACLLLRNSPPPSCLLALPLCPHSSHLASPSSSRTHAFHLSILDWPWTGQHSASPVLHPMQPLMAPVSYNPQVWIANEENSKVLGVGVDELVARDYLKVGGGRAMGWAGVGPEVGRGGRK